MSGPTTGIGSRNPTSKPAVDGLWLNEGQPQSGKSAESIIEPSRGPSNMDVTDFIDTTTEEDANINQLVNRKPENRGKTAKPRNSDLRFVPTPEVPAETIVINVPTEKATPKTPKKKVSFKEPTDREVNRQMKKSENTALEFHRKIKMRLYVDQTKTNTPLEEMELIENPHKADTWTKELQEKFQMGQACIDLKLVDWEEVAKNVGDKLSDRLRVKVLIEDPEEKSEVRRYLQIYNISEIRVNNAEDWNDADSLQVVGEDAVADVSLNSLTRILNMMEDIILETSQKPPEGDSSLSNITKKTETIIADVEKWKWQKPYIKPMEEAFYRQSQIHQKKAQAFLEVSSMEMTPDNRCMFEKLRLQHENALEHRRREPFVRQFYPVPYVTISQHRGKEKIINSLHVVDPYGAYDGNDEVFAAYTESGMRFVDVEKSAVARRTIENQIDYIGPSLRTKIEIFKQELPIWIPIARQSVIGKNWTCTLRRGNPPLTCENKPGENNLEQEPRCTYLRGERRGCNPGELDLFKAGLVNFQMPFESLLDTLTNADDYRSFHDSRAATKRDHPDYWNYPDVRKSLQQLDEKDCDIWLNLTYEGHDKRAIIRRALRKYAPRHLRLLEHEEWDEVKSRAIIEEEASYDLPLRRIIEVTSQVETWAKEKGYTAFDKHWPGVLSSMDKETWNELLKLSNRWKKKDIINWPAQPEYQRREQRLWHEQEIVKELLSRASPTKIWCMEEEVPRQFSELEFAQAMQKDLAWDMEHARRYPARDQKFPAPYTLENMPVAPLPPHPRAVAKLKYGEEKVREMENCNPDESFILRNEEEEPTSETGTSEKDVYQLSSEASKFLADGMPDPDRSNLLMFICSNTAPVIVDFTSFINNNSLPEDCTGKATYAKIGAKINGHVCVVMIDTGAESSILPNWAAKELGITKQAASKNIRIKGVTGRSNFPASKETVTIRLAGQEYTHKLWVIWSDAMDSLGMPLLGMDFLRGKPLSIALETNELVDRAGNRTPFHQGCSDRRCKTHKNGEKIVTAMWNVHHSTGNSTEEPRAPPQGEEIMSNDVVPEFSAHTLEPYLDDQRTRTDPSREEQKASYMFLNQSKVLSRPSRNKPNEYMVKMRTADNVVNGVYLLVPDEHINETYHLKIQRQLITIKHNLGEVAISNTSKTRNVTPSGHPLARVQLITTEEEQAEKSQWITSKDQFVDIGHVTSARVDESEEDKRLREDHFEEIWRGIEAEKSAMTEEQKHSLREVLRSCPVFPVPGREFATTSPYEHAIDLVPGSRPYKCYKYMRNSPDERRAVDEQVDEWLKTGVVVPSKSAWAAPVVLVAKKNTTKKRLCVSYIKLNNMTKKDSFPLPAIDEIMHGLGSSSWFGTLDLANGFMQIPIKKEDQTKTAFTCHKGLFEFTRMPFGLCNAPATFQRAMTESLEGLIWKKCFVYIDDIIVFGNTYEEYMQNMKEVLQKLAEHGLTINPKKCSFGQRDIKYLGHILSGEGHRIDPDRINALTHYPRPLNVADLWGFVGLAGFYRQFIRNYSAVVAPLQDKLKPDANLSWGMKEEEAFIRLKRLLSTDPVIGHFEPGVPCELRTDASLLGIGGILRQNDRIIGCKSRSLNKHEKNYSVSEWEALAIIYSIQKFKHFLEGTPFTVVTDHMPLLSMMKRGKETETENKRINKWLRDLVNYNFTLVYKKGKLHTDADAISRHPVDGPPNSDEEDCFGNFAMWEGPGRDPVQEDTHISSEEFKPAKLHFMLSRAQGPQPAGWRNVLEELPETKINASSARKKRTRRGKKHSTIDKDIDWDNERPQDNDDMRKRQEQDGNLKRIIDILEGTRKPSSRNEEKFNELYRFKNSVLCRKRTRGAETIDLECVPQKMIPALLKSLHDVPQAGHHGEVKTMAQVANKFYWRKWEADVKKYVKTCPRCQPFKHDKTGRQGFAGRTISHRIGHYSSIDYMGAFNESSRGNQFIVVYVDHFSRMIVAKAGARATAKEAADFLYTMVLTKYPGPENLVSDNGSHFTGEVVREISKLAGIKRRYTTPFHPQANTAAERVMGTIRVALGKIENNRHSRDWDLQLDAVVYAHNTSPNATTKYSPWEVMFKVKPTPPCSDFLTSLTKEQYESMTEYMQQMTQKVLRMNESVQASKENEFLRNSNRLDAKAKASTYRVGDHVMTQIKSRQAGQGSNKLAPLYTGPHEIISQNSEKRSFELKSLDKKGKISRASIDNIKPYYARRNEPETDDPKQDIVFRSNLELADKFKPQGEKTEELPVFKADKREDVILLGGDYTPKKYTSRAGRQTSVKQPYNDDAYLEEGSE